MVNTCECPQASLKGNQPTGINQIQYQVEGCFPVFAACGRYAGLLTACTELSYHRRQDTPKSSIVINFAERGNPIPSPPPGAG